LGCLRIVVAAVAAAIKKMQHEVSKRSLVSVLKAAIRWKQAFFGKFRSNTWKQMPHTRSCRIEEAAMGACV
jgi:hypothetical protein